MKQRVYLDELRVYWGCDVPQASTSTDYDSPGGAGVR
jgi:hypothetical protein